MAHSTSFSAIGFLLILSAWMGAFAGCATVYKPMQPMNIPYYREVPVEGDSNITTDIKYDIFSHSGNKIYAKTESKSNIHLVGLRINNHSDDTLYFPDNFAFYTNRYTIEPLHAEEAYSKITQYGNAFRLVNNTSIDLDHPLLYFILLPLTINEEAVFAEDQRMQKEFEACYLVYSTILPHTAVQGLVALPIDKTTLVRVAKR